MLHIPGDKHSSAQRHTASWPEHLLDTHGLLEKEGI
jgi:hypothetical protein